MQYIYLCNAAILSFRMKNMGNLNRDLSRLKRDFRKLKKDFRETKKNCTKMNRQPQNNRYFVAYLIFFRKFAAQNKMM